MGSIINDTGILGGGANLLSKKQAASELGVTYRTIERWYNCGYLDYVRIGGRVYVSHSEIHRIRDQFTGEQPNGNYMDTRIRSLDDVRDRQRRSFAKHHFGFGMQ
jgi:excisionase family DNA binding protein